MKTKLILICSVGMFGINLFGHEQPVHRKITQYSATAALNNSTALNEFISVMSSDRSWTQEQIWLRKGSYIEDNTDPADGGKRSYNHFYDPLDTLYGKGLSEVPIYGRRLVGNNSFVWGTTLACPGVNFSGVLWLGANENTVNYWSWYTARSSEWDGLTARSQAIRQSSLDDMFRTVGQVMHLLEDTTSPQHVRNEQHIAVDHLPSPWKSNIEKWGLQNVGQLFYGDETGQSSLLTVVGLWGRIGLMARKIRLDYEGAIYHPPSSDSSARQV